MCITVIYTTPCRFLRSSPDACAAATASSLYVFLYHLRARATNTRLPFTFCLSPYCLLFSEWVCILGFTFYASSATSNSASSALPSSLHATWQARRAPSSALAPEHAVFVAVFDLLVWTIPHCCRCLYTTGHERRVVGQTWRWRCLSLATPAT